MSQNQIQTSYLYKPNMSKYSNRKLSSKEISDKLHFLAGFFNLWKTGGSTTFFTGYLLFFGKTGASALLPETGFFESAIEQPAPLKDDLTQPLLDLTTVITEEPDPPTLFF